MIIKNISLRNNTGLFTIHIVDHIISKIEKFKADEIYDDNDVIDGEGNLAMPPYVEPHIHYDTLLTAGEPRWNTSGTLFEGIGIWLDRKKSLTKKDVKERAITAMKWQIAQGVQFVRTHIDITDHKLTALEAILEVKEEMSNYLEIQIVAFPQEGIVSFNGTENLIIKAIELGADAVGGIPHFEFTREDGVESVKKSFEIAIKYDKMLDFHCDEIDDEQSRFIEVVAAEAHKNNYGKFVSASHATAMHSYNNAYTSKLFRLLSISDISIIANPLVNINLQGRFDTFPKRRGITRVKELLDSGINVCFGTDDIFDPFYSLGTGNMLNVLNMGLHVCQMLGYEQVKKSFDLITTNSASALNITKDYGLEVGNTANLIIVSGKDEFDILRRMAPIEYSIRKGKVIAHTIPSVSKIFINGTNEVINFNK
ncbi:MAG: cytosine deaminase [Desulfosporosinus sp. BRH_c37]|nr:MAG: cytosine deaminase [Desulfosporosinus sp. BRH_c37]